MSSEVSSTMVKKMKQARLSFSSMDEKKQPKKRRSSVGDKNPKAGKIVCKETQNICTTDLDNDMKIDDEAKQGSKKGLKKTKDEKENILSPKIENSLKATGPVKSPICKKYAADSSCINTASPSCSKNSNKVQESNKKRRKTAPTKSPSIASLFKRIVDKSEIAEITVIQLSDDDEPQRKRPRHLSVKESPKKKIQTKKNTPSIDDVSNIIKTKKKKPENTANNLMNAETSTLNESLSKESPENSVLLDDSYSSASTPNRDPNVKKTPKQMDREKARMLKQEERDRMKEEKEKEKADLKLQKETDRQSKKEEIQKIKDEKIKKKQEENDVKAKEKDEKRLKKEEEKQKKDEEKQKREDEKQKKEEERQKREEDKLKQEQLKKLAEEEEIDRKEKLKQKFAGFFVPKKGENSPAVIPKDNEHMSTSPFMMFTVKGNMKLAPLVRRNFTKEVKESLDEFVKESKSETNYLCELKKPTYVIQKSFRTLPVQEKSDDCEIIDEECFNDVNNMISGSECIKHTVKAKLLAFCENRRPAYYGTWSKKSSVVTGRKPFVKAKDVFDYDYDSDEDWEEEETGESLSDSEGEEEEPEDTKYEEDNVFFVPHGYLSDDEGQEEENEVTTTDEEQKDGEVQKAKLKKKQEEFEIEMKQKMKPLKPKVYGCVWLNDEKSHQAYSQLVKIFNNYKAVNILGGEYPIGTTAGGENMPHDTKEANDDDETTSTKKFSKNFPEAAVPDLIKLIHGNRYGKSHLIREFYEHVKRRNNPEQTDLSPITTNRENIAKRKILEKIRSLGKYIRGSELSSNIKYMCWVVPQDIRDKYGLGDMSFENTWSYYFQLKEFPSETKPKEEKDETKEPVVQLKARVSLITKFTKVLTEEEKADKMKIASPHVDKMDVKLNTAEIDTPQTTSQPKTAKTPKSLKGISAAKNIEKFFKKGTPEKKDVECILLD